MHALSPQIQESAKPEASPLIHSDPMSIYPQNIVGNMIRLGSWDVHTSRYYLEQSQAEHEEMRGILHFWSRAFVREENFMRRYFGVPSLIVRADYFYKDGIKLCEIEERPAGIALTATVNRTFLKRTQSIFETLEKRSGKKIALVISEGRKGTSDDPYWANGMFHRHIPIFYGMPNKEARENHLFYVRANRNEEMYFDLTRESISSIASEGDKSYGLAMGLWSHIDDPEKLPWKSGVVLKPRTGSQFEEVLICRQGKHGLGVHSVSRGKLAIEEKKVAYWQPYFEPETPNFLNPKVKRNEGKEELKREGARAGRSESAPKIHMLRRAYWALDLLTENWVSLGGVWMASPTVRIHGSRESLCGPLLPAR